MGKEDKAKKPGEYTILTEHCKTKERLLSVVDQLADQDKQMNITTDSMVGWNVAYNTGPSHQQ